MKKQYILFLFLEACAISSHIFHEITAWVLAPENTTWEFPNKLVLFKDNSTLFSQYQARSCRLQLRKYIVISFPKEFRDQLLLISRSYGFSPAAMKPHLPPCFQLCCHRALSTQSASASHIAQELRARFTALPFYYFGDRGPTGPAVQNNYVEPCALFLFTLPLVGIYATPAGAKMSREL